MKIWIITLLLLFGLTACDKELKDTTPPVINSLSVDTDVVEPLGVVNVNISASDNAALNQVRVRISQAFSKTFEQWEVLSVRDISGTFYQGTFSFTVPDSATAGYYQIATQVADMEGNGSVDSLIYITVLQPESAPRLIGFQTVPPMIGEVLYLTSTDSLFFVGEAVDDVGLDKVSIVLQTALDQSIKALDYDIADTLITWSFTANADTILPNYDVYTPSELLIKILDSDGNLTRRSFPVEFTP